MRKTTLVIMAAGIGSRFGGGIKQLEPVGPNGEIIMDYSIRDALHAGFDQIVFIIRKDLERDFKEVIGNRIEKIADVSYAFQELDDLPAGLKRPADRVKPWGTGQAVLCCKGIVTDPFLVINADDYYGKEGFVKVHDYLVSQEASGDGYEFCMAGFILENTLSENGGVTRGVCKVDENGYLTDVTETFQVEKKGETVAGVDSLGQPVILSAQQHVSMNMWGLTPDFLDELELGFEEFLRSRKEDDFKSEYLLPAIIDTMIKTKKAKVAVLESRDKWFGVTYKEDKKTVADAIRRLVGEEG